MTTKRTPTKKAAAVDESIMTCETLAYAAVEASRKKPPTVHRMAVETFTQQVAEALHILIEDAIEGADENTMLRVAHALHGQSEIAYRASQKEFNNNNNKVALPDAVEA